MKKEIMVRAHELARGMEGDYQARLTLALRMAWAESKKEENGMKTLTWIGTKGNQMELRASCKTYMRETEHDLDGWKIKGDPKPYTDANLELWVDGKKIDSCWNTNFWQIVDTENGLRKIWGLPVGMTKEQAEIVEKFLQEVIEAGKSEEVKSYEAEKATAEKAKEIAAAQKIIDKAATYTQPLMTEAKYRAWARNYNNVMNEGCEGYIPEYITVEQLERARKIVSEA